MELLTLAELKKSASSFCLEISSTAINNLDGVTDGKAVGTYVESTFN